MWQQWVNALLGVWIIIVPFLNLTSTQNVWSLVIPGAAIALLGLWGATEHVSEHRGMKHA